MRPPWNDTVIIKRYLDLGVQTLLIPYIQDEQEARDAVAATRYPPLGVRGYAAAPRASDYGRVKDYPKLCEEQLCVLLQVETPHALANIEAIAAVDGVDGVFIGPGDLSAVDGLHRPADASGSGGGDRRRHRPHPRLRQAGRHPGRRRGSWRATTSRSAALSWRSAATSASWRAARKRSPPNSSRPPERPGYTNNPSKEKQHEQSRIHWPGHHGRADGGQILKGGHQLYAHDHKPLPADLAGQGAVACASGREVAQQADIIIIMVPDTPHVASVLFDEGGVAQGLSSGKIVVDMSSISPIETKQFAARINALGCAYLDAPVSGGEVGAQRGHLTIMVGGPEERSTPSSRCSN